MNLRPGVIVQETTFPEDERGQADVTTGVVRSRSGPAELQVPGRLSRSAYKVLATFPRALDARARTIYFRVECIAVVRLIWSGCFDI